MTGPTAGGEPALDARRPSADELLDWAIAHADTATLAAHEATRYADNGARPSSSRRQAALSDVSTNARLAEMYAALARAALAVDHHAAAWLRVPDPTPFDEHAATAVSLTDPADPGVADTLYGAGAPDLCLEALPGGGVCTRVLDHPPPHVPEHDRQPQGRVGHDEHCEAQYVLGRYTDCHCAKRTRPAPAGQRAEALAPHACATCTAAYRGDGEVGECLRGVGNTGACAYQCGSPACRGEPAPVGSALAHFLTFGRWPNGDEHRGRRLRPVRDDPQA